MDRTTLIAIAALLMGRVSLAVSLYPAQSSDRREVMRRDGAPVESGPKPAVTTRVVERETIVVEVPAAAGDTFDPATDHPTNKQEWKQSLKLAKRNNDLRRIQYFVDTERSFLDNRLDQESRDEEWASSMEAAFLEYMTTNAPPDANASDVTCRATLCRATVTVEGSLSAEKIVHASARESPWRNLNRFLPKQVGDDRKFYWFTTREGYELPDVVDEL
jgi:hypothetical protein